LRAILEHFDVCETLARRLNAASPKSSQPKIDGKRRRRGNTRTQEEYSEQATKINGQNSPLKARKRLALHRLFLPNADYKLQNLNVLCLPTLRAFGYVELNRLAFLKSAEAVCLNRCVVHKNVLTICTAQKAEPLGIVEPLDCTLFHCASSLVTR
jgi:uncharacterized protein YhdP